MWSATRGVCAFLVARPDTETVVPASTVAELAGRPDSLVAAEDLTVPGSYRTSIHGRTEVGWTATEVPPFYTLYEPQVHPFGSAPARRIWQRRAFDHEAVFPDGFADRNLSAWTTSDD